MQPIITIPKNWDYPRFIFGQRTEQGIILGMEYYLPSTQLAYQYGQSLCSNSKCKMQNSKLLSSSILNFELLILNCFGWRYAVMPHSGSEEIRYYFDDQLQTLSSAEIQQQLQAEIEEYQQQIKALQQQLAAIAGGSSNG